MLEKIRQENVELLRTELSVLVPPDGALGLFVADDELVFRRAAGVHAGLGAKRAAFHDMPFISGERIFVKLLSGQIPVDRGEVL